MKMNHSETMTKEKAAAPLDKGRKALFLDDIYIQELKGLERVWHQPVKQGEPVLFPERPWEKGCPRTSRRAGRLGEGSCCSTPIWDSAVRVWKMWYNGGIHGLPLYAESADGIHWEKPDLGLVEWEGSKHNNIYDLHGDGTFYRDFKRNGPSIVRDDDDPDPSRRFKGIIPPNLTRIVSSDGLTWRRMEGSIPADDTFHLEYDKRNRQFLLTAKLNITKPKQGVSDYPLPSDYRMGRTVWLYTSRDFENWDGPELLMYPNPEGQRFAAAYIERIKSDPTRRQPLIDDPAGLNKLPDWAGGDDGAGDTLVRLKKHVAAMFGGTEYKADIYTMPVCEYEGMYLGFPTRMITTGPYTWEWNHGDRVERGSNGDGPQYVFLAYCRDLHVWQQREETPFIDTSPITDENIYDNGMVMGAAPVRHGDELRFYYNGFRYTHHQHHELAPEWYARAGITDEMHQNQPVGAIFLVRLRLDGFVSLRAGAHDGELLTRPFACAGGELRVNVNDPGGELRVEVCDENGKVLPGYEKENGIPVSADSTDTPVRWREYATLSDLSGRRVRLRFSLRRGDLYSFYIQ